MHFCIKCGNMYYIKINEDDDELIYNCRKCGHKNNTLINRIKSNNFTKSTLGGCIIEIKDNFILISKELRMKKVSYQLRR